MLTAFMGVPLNLELVGRVAYASVVDVLINQSACAIYHITDS